MKRSELVNSIAEEVDTTRKHAELCLKTVLELISDSLAEGEEIRFPGFGSFATVDRKATTARNPRTGETIQVPARKVVRFKPAKALKESV